MNKIVELKYNIDKYRKKYLLNLLIKGFSLFGLFIISSFLILNYIEYLNFFNKTIRAIFFFSYISIFISSFLFYIVYPYLNYKKTSSDEEIAKIIGENNQSIKDKLLNTIILMKNFDNSLALASVHQRTIEFSALEFDKSINMRTSFKYLTYLGFIALFFTSIYIYKPLIISGSTTRIINFNSEFKKPQAFHFEINTKKLEVFENEDFTINFKITGKIIPSQVYIIENTIKHKAILKNNNVSYTFKNINANKNFKLASAGIESEEFTIVVNKRPSIIRSIISTKYPQYINKKNTSFENISELIIPEGTILNFELETIETEKVSCQNDTIIELFLKNNNTFKYSKKFNKPKSLHLKLSNEKGENKEKITYNIQIIKDLSPKITLETFIDTALYSYISLAGLIEDDYGIRKLNLNYKTINSKDKYKTISIPISSSSKQTYGYVWNIDSFNINKEEIEYFLEVWDNDEVNGSKSSRTELKKIKKLNSESIKKEIENEKNDVSSSLEKNLEDLKKLKESLNKTNEKLKAKKELSWQDKKDLEKIASKQNELQKAISELAKDFEKLKQKKDKFDTPSEKLNEKEEQLQQLLNEMIDDETKKMFEELNKLLEKKDVEPEKISSLLEEMQKKDFNLEKELERAKELYKKLKMEDKIEEIIKKLDELAQKQEQEAEKNKEKLTEEQLKENQKTQEEINKEFEKIKENIDEIKKLNEESKSKLEEKLTQQEKEAENIQEEQKNATEELKQGKNSKSSSKQQNASDKMKKMSQDMKDMKGDMESDENEEDLKNLRNILNNLIKLSYNQEDLMVKFRTIRNINPQFVEHSAKQLKIKNDATIIEDSLLALASRNFQIQSFVTKELFNMNDYIDKSLNAIKDRDIGKITGNQQFAMTSINNLALLLSEVMEQMQKQQAEQKGGEQMCNKPKGNKPNPNMTMGKKQGELSQQIKDLKKSGKTGKEQSEQLAKLASEQEQLRKSLEQLRKMQDKGKNGSNGDIGKLEKLMEENEIDLINKRITEKTIQRQEEILTRLLQAENAIRERDLDEKRESKTAKELQRDYPPAFEKYLKDKEKEIEMLKTINPKYTPYYKNKVSEYLNQL